MKLVRDTLKREQAAKDREVKERQNARIDALAKDKTAKELKAKQAKEALDKEQSLRRNRQAEETRRVEAEQKAGQDRLNWEVVSPTGLPAKKRAESYHWPKVENIAAMAQYCQNMSKLVISDLHHVEQHEEEGWCQFLLIEDNFIMDSIQRGAGLHLGCFEGGHDVGFLLHGGQVHWLPHLIGIYHIFLISDYIPEQGYPERCHNHCFIFGFDFNCFFLYYFVEFVFYFQKN